MRYFLVAGEKSGDLHGGNLIKAIKKEDNSASFAFLGGDEMQHVTGVAPIVHIEQLAMMGFFEVLKQYRKIKGFLKQCKAEILAFKPDAVILIDYAGFNFKVAEFAHKNGMEVHYYISPKLWAWNQKRALKVKKYVKHMYCILPFEVDFYEKFNFKADYIGNPILDEIEKFNPSEDFLTSHAIEDSSPIIALLPGSRKNEISNVLSLLEEVIPQFPHYQFVIAGVSHFDRQYYEQFLGTHKDLTIVFDDTYNLLNCSEAAIVTSGTATLETSLLNVPQVVVYKIGSLSYAILKLLVKVKYISLANLVADQNVVVELIQGDLTAENLQKELKAILKEGERRTAVLDGNRSIMAKVGASGASRKAAKLIVSRIS